MPTRYEWSRTKHLVKERPGVHAWRIVYFCRIDAYTILNVWREGSGWRYVVISTAPRLVLAHGGGPTMHETKLRAEATLNIEPPQRSIWDYEQDGTNAKEPSSKLPF